VADYRLIQTDSELRRLLERLRQENPDRLAVDLESEHNLHSYGIHVALVQLYDGKLAYLVDTLAVRDQGLLRSLLEESPWVKVMFDASGDLATLGTSLGMSIRPVFDLAVAARLLGQPGSLNKLLNPESTGGKSKYQKANWLKRPLPSEQLEYAAGDVLPLLGLADRLLAELMERGLLYRFLAANARVQVRPAARDPNEGYRRLPAFGRLPPAQKKTLALLWQAREKYAERHDLPPHNVAAHDLLVAVAREAAADPHELATALGRRQSGRVRIDVQELAALLRDLGAGPEAE
jgi:ribonuclease D